MRRTVPLAIVVLVLTAAPAQAAHIEEVTVSDFSFAPARVVLDLEPFLAVRWTNTGSETHTATSNLDGLFDTRNILVGTAKRRAMDWAGTFPYRCTIHDGMSGRIRVRPHASTTAAKVGDRIRIMVADPSGDGAIFDVQRRRNGGSWTRMYRTTSLTTFVFQPGRVGTYDFRARVYNGSGQASGWSPVRKVSVT